MYVAHEKNQEIESSMTKNLKQALLKENGYYYNNHILSIMLHYIIAMWVKFGWGSNSMVNT